MNCLKVENGDLVLDNSGSLSVVSGHDRIRQELSCWILEPFGTDKYFTKFGSLLHQYIGEPSIAITLSNVRNEIGRVISNYESYQRSLYNDSVSATGSANAVYTWLEEDILTGDYTVSANVDSDKINVSVVVKTNGGETITIDEVL